MAGRYDRKQTRYDPARAGAHACACLIGIAVLECCFRCARCIAHTRRFCRAVRCCTMHPEAIGGRTMAWMLPLLPGMRCPP